MRLTRVLPLLLTFTSFCGGSDAFGARLPDIDEGGSYTQTARTCLHPAKYYASIEVIGAKFSRNGPAVAWDVEQQHPSDVALEGFCREGFERGLEAGYRFSFGKELPFDGWDARFDWMRLSTREMQDKTEAIPSIVPILLIPNGDEGLAENGLRAVGYNSKWDFHLNRGDLQLMRSYFIGKHFSVNPKIGLVGLWIGESINCEYLTVWEPDPLPPHTFHTFLGDRKYYGRADFHGFGPKMGMDFKWSWKYGFALYCKSNGGIAWGVDTLRYRIFVKGDESISQPELRDYQANVNKEHRSKLMPFVDMQMGISWDFCTKSERYGYNLAVGYESQYYFHKSEAPSPRDINVANDFATYGLVITGRVNF